MLRTAALILALGLAFPVKGAVVAEVVEGDARVELHDVAGPCQARALWAVFFKGQTRVSGCWILGGDFVQIAWMDGDVSQIAVRAFREPRSL
jgi:hypothetical protein